jgi:hypothetical protein
MSESEQIALNGYQTWAYVVELDCGLRMRLDLTDWERMNLDRGQRIPVCRAGRRDEWMCVAEVVELPPLVWRMLANQFRAAG